MADPIPWNNTNTLTLTPPPAAPQPAQPAQAPQSGALDPKIVTLAQSIRQVESGGNFQASGKSGEYGAYQFMPETWAGTAPKYGVNVPLQQATPAQQNEVAYKQLSEWSQQHPDWNVGNFASAWNAGPGKPNAYLEGNAGTNSQGIQYDTPAYAQKVATTYQSLKAQNPNLAQPSIQAGVNQPAPPPSIGGFLGNALQSGANFVGNLGDAALHPIRTVQNLGGAAVGGLQELGGQQNDNTAKFDALKNYFIDRYKSPDAILHTAYTDPVGLAADISTVLGVGGGAVGLAGKAADVAGLETAADAAKTASSVLSKGAQLTNPITPLAVGAKALLKASSGPLTSIASQFTEISPRGMADIIAHPQDYPPEAIANTSRATLAEEVKAAFNTKETSVSETGTGYDAIKKGVSDSTGVSVGGKNAIPVAHDFLENQLRTVAKLDVIDGKIIPTTVSKVGKAEVTKLQDVLNTFKPAFQSGHITPEEFLTLRSRLADAAYNDSGIKNTNVAKLAEDIRNNLNTTYRGAVPGLAELDANYSTQLQEVKLLRKGLFDKEGNLLKTAINKIANATGKGKDEQLKQLEAIMPGVTRKIQILQTMQEIEDASGIKVGAYAKSITEAGGVVAGLSTGNLPLLAGSLAVAIITSPKVAVPLLRLYGFNQSLVSSVMANLAKYATTGAVTNQATNGTGLQSTQSPPETPQTLPNANPSTETGSSPNPTP